MRITQRNQWPTLGLEVLWYFMNTNKLFVSLRLVHNVYYKKIKLTDNIHNESVTNLFCFGLDPTCQ